MTHHLPYGRACFVATLTVLTLLPACGGGTAEVRANAKANTRSKSLEGASDGERGPNLEGQGPCDGTLANREVSEYDDKALKKHVRGAAPRILARLNEALRSLEDWTTEAIHEQVHGVASELEVGLGKVAQPLRVAVAGTAVSPPIDATLAILGREETIRRIDRLLDYLDQSANERQS